MATANSDLETCEEFKELLKNISECVSGVTKELNVREHELSSKLEKLIRDNLKKMDILSSDRDLLRSTIEQIRSTFISDSLSETGNKAIKPLEDKLISTERVIFNCSPQKLFKEIDHIGSFTIIPSNQCSSDGLEEIKFSEELQTRTGSREEAEDLKDCCQFQELREVLTQFFTSIKKRLEEREIELTTQLGNLCRENLKEMKLLPPQKKQLNETIEHIQSTLISSSQSAIKNEAIKLMQDSLSKLDANENRIWFNWSSCKLFTEIEGIGSWASVSIKHEISEIQRLLSHPLATGEVWYLIHISWFKQWKRFVGFESFDRDLIGDLSIYPGPVDNTYLLESGKLRRDLVDGKDYQLVPEEAWNSFLSWYGITKESDVIKRFVVKYGKFVKQCKVEIYPLELKCCLYPNETGFSIVSIPRCDTLRTLDNKMRQIYNIGSQKQTRVYKGAAYTYDLIEDLNQDTQDAGLFDGHCVLMEVQNEDGTWPRNV